MDNLIETYINSVDELKNNNIDTVISNSIEAVNEGYADIEEVYLILNDLNKYITSKLSELKPDLVDLIMKEDKNILSSIGYNFSITSGGKYDYKHIVQWADLNKELKKIEETAKSLYKSNEPHLLNEQTGEIIEQAKYKANKPGVKITKKKK